MSRRVVYQNDGSVPPEEILCTTYQMRDFYKQFRDGFAGPLDVMNYMQHLAACRLMREGDVVLDVACGRGLLLPLMRYHAKGVKKYIGVDIADGNMAWTSREWPFETEAVVSDAAEMAGKIGDRVDFCVYTSSIEHMHKEHGARSLRQCAEVMGDGATLFLSCPNTPEGADGYDVQYKAHVYEWKRSELRAELEASGFVVEREYGLHGNVRDFRAVLKKAPRAIQSFFEPLLEYAPREFLTPVLFAGMPGLAKEVLMVARRLPRG